MFEEMLEELPPSGFTARHRSAGVSRGDAIVTERKLLEYHRVNREDLKEYLDNTSEVFDSVLLEHDLEIERWVFYLYTIDLDTETFHPDDIVRSYLEVPEPEKDFYRLITEKLLVDSDTNEMEELMRQVHIALKQITD